MVLPFLRQPAFQAMSGARFLCFLNPRCQGNCDPKALSVGCILKLYRSHTACFERSCLHRPRAKYCAKRPAPDVALGARDKRIGTKVAPGEQRANAYYVLSPLISATRPTVLAQVLKKVFDEQLDGSSAWRLDHL